MAAENLLDSPLEVSWDHLAHEDPEFKAMQDASGGEIDFKDTNVLRQLTISTLKVYFGLKIQLPLDRLLPPVPGRFEYIRWITGLLKTSSRNFDDKIPEGNVKGLDIGTGASCIYPLLGCATHENWSFVGTEIDDKSYRSACKNVKANNLEDRIILQKVKPGHVLIDPNPIAQLDTVFDFAMCNPPFYSSKAEILESKSDKSHLPAGVCTGAEVEMITEGGEMAFATRMVEDSVKLRYKIKWFSIMFGVNRNAFNIIPLLKAYGVNNFAVKVFQPGKNTKRIGIAWSFGDMRPMISDHEYKETPEHFQRILPLRNTVIIEQESLDRAFTWQKIGELLMSRGVEWRPEGGEMTGICLSKTDVWSRSARRKAQNPGSEKAGTDQLVKIHESEATFVARISVFAHTSHDEVEVRWLKGTEERFFISLQSSLRAIAKQCADSTSGAEPDSK